MNQKQRAIGIVAAIVTMEGKLRSLHDQLAATLEQSQNDPPDGMADGSVSSDEFELLRRLERHMHFFDGALAGAKGVK
jgi:hypothetical protein